MFALVYQSFRELRENPRRDRRLSKDSKQEKTPIDPQPSATHSRSRPKERIKEIQVGEDSKDEISEITTPAVLLRAPPPHSRIRALKPKRRNKNEGSTMHLGEGDDGKESRTGFLSEVDVRSKVTPVSALTTPNIPPPIATALRTMNSAPVSSQHLQTKKQSAASEDLHQSLPVLDEEGASPTQGNLPQVGNSKQSSAYNKFAPPPPRRHRPAPPPRHEHNNDSFQQQKQHFRRQHQPTMATVHNSIEDLAASFFSSSEMNRPRKNVTTSPVVSVCPTQTQQQSDNDSVHSERLKPPAPPPKRAQMSHLTRNDLDNAAAQLVNMQSQSRGQPNSDFEAGEAPLPFNSQQHIGMQVVVNMPYTDYYSGNCGLYSGSCDNFGRPHGQGVIMYDNNTCIKVSAKAIDSLHASILRFSYTLPSGNVGQRCIHGMRASLLDHGVHTNPGQTSRGTQRFLNQELGAMRGPRLKWAKVVMGRIAEKS